MTVRLYTRQGCHLCDQVAADLAALAPELPHARETLDIDADPTLQRRYDWLVPVVVVDRRYVLVSRIDREMMRRVLQRAS